MLDEALEQELAAADRAVEFAQQVRARHRRRTDRSSPQRAQDVGVAMAMLKEAMRPLRSRIGRFPTQSQSQASEAIRAPVYGASLRLQAERRKLWKLLAR